MALLETPAERDARIRSQTSPTVLYDDDGNASPSVYTARPGTRDSRDFALFSGGDIAAFAVAAVMILAPLAAGGMGWGS